MSSNYQPMTIICNVRSGRGRVVKHLSEVRGELDRRNLDYNVALTERRGHASELARDALERGVKLLVAMGGDGTIHEVVNGMIDGDRAVTPDAALGVIAAGTGSDFIKTFGLPAAPIHAVSHLDGDEAFPIDIGKVTYEHDGTTFVRYFPNIAEVGLGAAVVARAQRLPRWFGPMVYFFSFWLTIRSHRAADVAVDLVDRSYEGPMNNLVVANGHFFGGGMHVAPRSTPTDGLLDIQIEHARKREAIAILPKMYKGQHLPHPDIEEFKRARVTISADRPLPVEADGELLGTTPATFEVLRDAIHLKV
jgi:diacylglycerol kinase (ATP)